MPNVVFDKDYIYRLFGSRLKDSEFEMQVMKMGLSIESSDKESFTIEVDANRPDLLDPVGFVRALRNFMHRGRSFDYAAENEIALTVNVGKEIEPIRPYIAALVVKKLKLDGESLKHMINFTEKFCETFGRSRHKIAIGMHDLSAITPPITYNAFKDEKFVPLGSNKEMLFSEVVSGHEKGSKYGNIIKNDKKLFPAIKDAAGVMALIPILNSERTKVTEKTTEIFVDITGTESYYIGKTADLLAAMFIDLGAEVYKAKIVRYNGKSETYPKLDAHTITMPLTAMELQIGVAIGFNNIISLANKMGYKAALIGKKVKFYIPPYRVDILNEQDITEDIAIAYGYDYIRALPIYSAQQGSTDIITGIERRIASIMVGMGFSEEANYYLTNEDSEYKLMHLAQENGYIKIKNAKAAGITMLRTSILPSLLSNLGKSAHERMPQKLFEFDMTFGMKDKKPVERYSIGAVIADPKGNFNEVKAVVQALLDELYGKYAIEPCERSNFIPGRCAKAKVNGKEIGYFGELHPEVLANFGIEEPSFAMEFEIINVVE